ncbi:hypothetical protein SAMN06298211_10816 [Prevotellaceae bacterium MN60]|nr:hypothetical protein SAMN06298211_10816 [Prevotellaceae bacterium MN60]
MHFIPKCYRISQKFGSIRNMIYICSVKHKNEKKIVFSVIFRQLLASKGKTLNKKR